MLPTHLCSVFCSGFQLVACRCPIGVTLLVLTWVNHQSQTFLKMSVCCAFFTSLAACQPGFQSALLYCSPPDRLALLHCSPPDRLALLHCSPPDRLALLYCSPSDRLALLYCSWPCWTVALHYIYITFSHLADVLIQSDLQ